MPNSLPELRDTFSPVARIVSGIVGALVLDSCMAEANRREQTSDGLPKLRDVFSPLTRMTVAAGIIAGDFKMDKIAKALSRK